MHAKYLVSEYAGHVVDHLFRSSFLDSLLVIGYCIEALEGESNNAVLTVFDPQLSIDVSFKVAFDLLQLFDEVGFPFFFHVLSAWLINPLK